MSILYIAHAVAVLAACATLLAVGLANFRTLARHVEHENAAFVEAVRIQGN